MHVRRIPLHHGPRRKGRNGARAGGGESDLEAMGMQNRANRGTTSGLFTSPTGLDPAAEQTKEFDVLEQYAKLNAPPPIKFKDLEEESVSHKIILNLMPFDVRADFVKVTSDTVFVPVTIRSRIATSLL